MGPGIDKMRRSKMPESGFETSRSTAPGSRIPVSPNPGQTFTDSGLVVQLSRRPGLSPSGRFSFQPVLVMQPAQHRFPDDLETLGQRMTIGIGLDRQSRRRIGNPRPQRHVRPGLVVMSRILPQNSQQMTLVEGDHVIETLPAERAVEPFDKRVRLRRSRRCPQRLDPERPDRFPENPPEHPVPIMNQKAPSMITGNRLPELLNHPRRTGRRRHVDVENPPGADLHQHEDVHHPKPRRPDRQEITGQSFPRMIAHERRPGLPAGTRPGIPAETQILPDRRLRHPDHQLQPGLIPDPSRTPQRIFLMNSPDHPPDLVGEGRTPLSKRPSPPQQRPHPPVPPADRIRSYHHERLTPGRNQAGQEDHRDPLRIPRPPGPDPALLVHRQLLFQQQHPGLKLQPRTKPQPEKTKAVPDHAGHRRKPMNETA